MDGSEQVLPDSLSEALVQAAESTHLALDGPGGRYLVCLGAGLNVYTVCDC